jgi:Family of unknown function (DUF6272)
MSLAPTKAVEVCHSQYQEIYSEYNRTSRLKIIVSHFGEFSQDLVNSITNSVEETMLSMGDKKGTVKKMFSILVEGLQNIRLHGVRDELENQSSFVIIAQDEKEYLVTFGNIILNDIWPYIEDKIKQINGYTEEEVKALYMEVLTNGVISSKGGAGLGFITMAMKSKNKLHYRTEKINDDLSCFSVEVKIDRAGV